MFIRYHSDEALYQIAQGGSYGKLLEELVLLAKQYPSGFTYIQIGDLYGSGDKPDWFDSVPIEGVKELVVNHPIITNRVDHWIAMPIKDWPRFHHQMSKFAKAKDISEFYALGKERKWNISDALDFARKIFYNLNTGTSRLGTLEEWEINVERGCEEKAIEAWEANQMRITLWNRDLWQAALSGSSIFENESITWKQALEKMPHPHFWVLDQPLPCRAPIIIDNQMKRIDNNDLDYVEASLRAMLMFPVKLIGDESYEWAGVITRMMILETPESPIPIVEWTTFTLRHPHENQESGRLLQSSHVKSLSMIEAWALNEFMDQKVVKVIDTPPPRHIRRRAERENKKIPKIQTIYLRRQYIKSDEHSESIPTEHLQQNANGNHREVEWNWQWLTRAHWREQWYASEGVHKKIFIAPFWKGPENKPIKPPGDKIFKVVR